MKIANMRTKILKKNKEQLADIIISLLEKMTDEEKEDFEREYLVIGIRQQRVDNSISQADIAAVDKFCSDCLNGLYKVDMGPDEYYDFYDEQSYWDRPWASEFAYYFRLAEEYADAECNDTAYKIFSQLFECLSKAKNDYEILGTSEPLTYINVNFPNMFETYFGVMKSYLETRKSYLQMLIMWEWFHDDCTGLMYDNITDLEAVKEAFLEEVRKSSYARGEKILTMLTNIYESNNKKFDKLPVALELLSLNSDYSLYATWSYLENKEYIKAIETATKHMDMVDSEIAFSLKIALIKAYEKSGQREEAFKVCFNVFEVEPEYILYKRLRHLSDGVMSFDDFFGKAEKILLESNNWQAKDVYRYVVSYEGMLDKLIKLLPVKVNSDYQSVKYTVCSIVYRAVKDEEMLGASLTEFVSSILDESISGIVDIEQKELTAEEKTDYLQKALEIIKEMISYHIGAGTETRYEKAAYYLDIALDIWSILDQKDEADNYVAMLLEENKKRLSLKSELRKRLILASSQI